MRPAPAAHTHLIAAKHLLYQIVPGAVRMGTVIQRLLCVNTARLPDIGGGGGFRSTIITYQLSSALCAIQRACLSAMTYIGHLFEMNRMLWHWGLGTPAVAAESVYLSLATGM